MKIAGKTYTNLEELEGDAAAALAPAAFGYYASGAESEAALRGNRAALERLRLLPRCLVDVSAASPAVELLGLRLAMPVIVAPMAMQRMCCPEGELAMAAAAAAVGAGMTLSTMATSSLEEVAAAAAAAAADRPSPGLWFQLYVLTRRDVTAAMVRAAEAAGYRALVVTVDAPRLGRREADERSGFALPPGLSLKMLERMEAAAAAGRGAGGGGGEGASGGEGSRFGRHFTSLIDDSLTWEVIPWLRTVTSLPILVKGVLAPDDARRAVAAGADGIVVSNHGGRQLDYAPAAVEVLPAVAAAVAGRVPIIVDGGVRRGTDVLKCLALGASAVMVGRPMLWALALGGREGATAALRALRDEIELGMALLGCATVGEVTRDYVMVPQGGLTIPPARL